MPLDINAQFDLHTRALGLANQRLELLADNVANADTPNYKARDIDFRAAMADAGQNRATLGGDLAMTATRARHLQVGGASPEYHDTLIPGARPAQPGRQHRGLPEGERGDRRNVGPLPGHPHVPVNSRIRGLRDAITGGR